VRCVEGETVRQYHSTTTFVVRFCASVFSLLLYYIPVRYTMDLVRFIAFSVCIVFWLLLPYSIIQSFFDCPSSFQYFICVVLSSLMMTVSVFYLYISFVFELPKRWFSLLVSILILS